MSDLKALAAERHEDLRIAKKHEREAEDRYAQDATDENYGAFKRAQIWRANRKIAYHKALAEWNAAAEKALS